MRAGMLRRLGLATIDRLHADFTGPPSRLHWHGRELKEDGAMIRLSIKRKIMGIAVTLIVLMGIAAVLSTVMVMQVGGRSLRPDHEIRAAQEIKVERMVLYKERGIDQFADLAGRRRRGHLVESVQGFGRSHKLRPD